MTHKYRSRCGELVAACIKSKTVERGGHLKSHRSDPFAKPFRSVILKKMKDRAEKHRLGTNSPIDRLLNRTGPVFGGELKWADTVQTRCEIDRGLNVD